MIFGDVIRDWEDGGMGPMILPKVLEDAGELITDDVWGLGVIVELGCYHGSLTVRLCDVAKRTGVDHVHVVDTWNGCEENSPLSLEERRRHHRNIFEKNVERFGFSDMVVVHQGKTGDVGAVWEQPIGFLVIDASHYYDDALSDLRIWAPHVSPGGMIFMDDYGPWGGTPGPQGACHDFVDEQVGNYDIIHAGNHFALLRSL